MSIHAVRRGGMHRPKKQESHTSRFPAPHRGVDARSPLAKGSPEVCIYTYNLVPDDGGLKLRKGFSEWQIAVDNGAGLSVNTIIPFDGLAADGTDDRLFAATNEGIWDVTAAAGTPVLKVAFGTQTADAGYGVYVTYISDAGVKSMYYADSLNGLYAYDVATDAWALEAGITGPTIANINFVAVHKQRIWLIEKDSPDAWYLGIGADTGAATKFYFGSKLKSGGALRGLFSWTIDGGAGVDDMLVGVSAAGDVIVYQGDDPSAANTWEMRGVYFIGTLPKGPKFGTEEGGELYLLSTYGLISMNDLLQGASVASPDGMQASSSIAGVLRARMQNDRDLNGWAVSAIPSEGGLLISAPVRDGVRPQQYYYNVTVKGWGYWRDLDIQCFANWKDAVIFGDSDLRVCSMNTEVDNVLITPPALPALNAVPIEFSILTSFSPLGAEGLHKIVQFIRPDTISLVEPNFSAMMRYDYSSLESENPLAAAPAKVGIWDVDDWDAVVWGPDGQAGWNTVHGSAGIGRNAAVAYRGQAYNAFTLVGWDVIFKVGGPLL